jgi:hypothetical protein
VRGRSVDADHATVALGPNGVGHEPLAVVDVVDMYLFVLENSGSLEQGFVDRAGALIVQFDRVTVAR